MHRIQRKFSSLGSKKIARKLTYELNPGRIDKNLCRCFGAPVRRVFPDHLIT